MNEIYVATKKKSACTYFVKQWTILSLVLTILISYSSCELRKIENNEEYKSLNQDSIIGVYNNIAYYNVNGKLMSLSFSKGKAVKNVIADNFLSLGVENNILYYKQDNSVKTFNLLTQENVDIITSNHIVSIIKKNNYIYYSEDFDSKVINIADPITINTICKEPCIFTPNNAYYVETEKTYSSFTLFGHTQTVEENIIKLNTCDYNNETLNILSTEDISKFTFYENSLFYCKEKGIYKINSDGSTKTMVNLDNPLRNVGSVAWGDGSDDNIYIKDGYIYYKTNYFYTKGNASYLQIDTFKISVDGTDFSVVGEPYITKTYGVN